MTNNKAFRWLAIVSIASGTLVSVLLAQSTDSKPIYLDPARPIDERIDDLMGRMTLKEKVGQLNLPSPYVEQFGQGVPAKRQACERFAAGTYTGEIGPGSGFFTL